MKQQHTKIVLTLRGRAKYVSKQANSMKSAVIKQQIAAVLAFGAMAKDSMLIIEEIVPLMFCLEDKKPH